MRPCPNQVVESIARTVGAHLVSVSVQLVVWGDHLLLDAALDQLFARLKHLLSWQVLHVVSHQ